MEYYDNKNNIIEIEKEIGKGEEGTVFSLKNGDVLKIYNESSLSVQKEEKIKALISKEMRFEGICFPKEIIFNKEKEFVGYSMLKADGYEMTKTIFQPALLKERFPNWTREDLCIIGINILKKIEYLHSHNIIIGNINPNNILLTEEKNVYFVDTDSYQIDNYPCPVGTTRFTAPEIQGVNFETSLRTISHENFAISTLLFMIFLPGKSPYSSQGGGSIKENISSKNFSYPLGDDDNLSAPKGMWGIIWYELGFDLRSSFFNTFKKGARFNVMYWINTLTDYQNELSKRLYQKEIIPSDTSKILKGRTLNMNLRDITEKDDNLTIIKTKLIPNPNEKKYAVIELSTKAVKLLFAKNTQLQDQLKEDGFSFHLFYREGRKTETGKGLNDKNEMDMVFFNKRVIPVIQQMIRKAKQNDIEIIYSVATAAYRTALNRSEIIKTIKGKCGLNVKILSKEEESRATITAFVFSKPKHLSEQFSKANNILMIDQGGGSTEITLHDEKTNPKGKYSLNLGTTVMKTILFREATKSTTLDSALKNVTKLIKDRLNTFLKSTNSDFLKNNTIDMTLSVGTAITNATNKKGNKDQHGTILRLDSIKDTINRIDEKLKSKYDHRISDLLSDLEENNKGKERLDNLIVMRVGLVMFIEIMENFNISELIVSGTGLWYGIYFQQVFKLK